MREDIPGYDTSYRYGQDPKIDKAVDTLNKITTQHGGGIACLDENGNIVTRYTEQVVLDLPDTMPKDVAGKAKAAALNVLRAMGVNGIGLGAEKNRRIAEYLIAGNHEGLLLMITQEEDRDLTCEVIINSMFDFNEGSREQTVNNLLRTALSNIGRYATALITLIRYTWNNHLKGERFLKNPYKNEYLLIDDDGQLISFQGEIETFTQGEYKGRNYISYLGKYTVLTGPNMGKAFTGSSEAGQNQDLHFRPIRGTRLYN